MQLTTLFSGSSGNCILIQDGNTNILIDAGVSALRIQQMLKYIEVDLNQLDAILITHEHDDHIAGAGIACRKWKAPVYANEKTYQAMLPKIGKHRPEDIHVFATGSPFEVNGLQITPFAVSHDAAEPVGYNISDGKKKLAVATDLGYVAAGVMEHLSGCDAVLLEANHDTDLLMQGPYPAYLKKRILSEHGHLSNEAAGACCAELVRRGTTQLCMGHLSKQNNTALLALNTIVSVMDQKGIKRGTDYSIQIACRDLAGDTIALY